MFLPQYRSYLWHLPLKMHLSLAVELAPERRDGTYAG